MRNHWLLDDQVTRREIYSYILKQWNDMGVPNIPLSTDQLDFCIDHAVRHVEDVTSHLTSYYATNDKSELPPDAALIVSTYYRDLHYKKLKKGQSTACKPAHDWVIAYFSKSMPEWLNLKQQIKDGALSYSYTVLHHSLSKSHSCYVPRENAKSIWEAWKTTFKI